MKIEDTERSSFRTGVEEYDSEVRIDWRFGNCCWRGRRPIAPEIVEKVTVAMAENAGHNVQSSCSEDCKLHPGCLHIFQYVDSHEEQQHYCCYFEKKTALRVKPC